MLFFTNHQTDYIGGVKAQQKYSSEDFVAIMVTGNDGLKAQKKYCAEDCGATVVTSNDGLKARQEYSPGQRPGDEWDSYFAL